MPGLECDDKAFDDKMNIALEADNNYKSVFNITDHCSRILQQSRQLRNRKVRDREPSRISLKKSFELAKTQKTEKKKQV